MNLKLGVRVTSLLIIMALFSLPMMAQETTGAITGTVRDQSGAVIPGATVTITNQETDRETIVTTDSTGNYHAEDLQPGRYTIGFQATGFASGQVVDIQVLLGRTAPVDVNMQVGGITQTLTVVSTPIIDTSTTMVSLNIPSEEIDRLPKGRNFQNLATYLPSVNTGEIEGGFQVNGASGAENNYYIDGVSTTSVIDGSARQSSVFEFVQEVQVKTTGLEAEYGGALGGVVTAVTKQGGNSFHGELHYYYYGNRLNASPTRRLELDLDQAPTMSQTVAYVQDKKQRNDYHEFGATLSGPIVEDKLWFFSSLAPRWQRAAYTYNTADDRADTLFRDSLAMNWFSKLSYDPNSRIRTNFTYLYTPRYLTGSLPAYESISPNNTSRTWDSLQASRTRGYNQPENSWSGSIDFTLSSSSLLSVKGGRYYLNFKEIGIPYDSYMWYQSSSIGIEGVPEDLQQPAGFRTPSAAQIVKDLTTRTYIQADFIQYARFAGQHNFKFGVGVQKTVNDVYDAWVGAEGRVLVYWDLDHNGMRGQYGYYEVDDAATRGGAASAITHLYLQDSWRVHPRLTLNIGARFERETIPAFDVATALEEIGTSYAFQFGFGDKAAARLGASFDVFGDGKVKVFGGWGRFYDWTKYDLPRGIFGGDLWHTYYRALDTPNVDELDLGNMPGANLEAPAEFIDWRFSDYSALDPNVKPMSADIMNVGVDYEIVPQVVFSARYTRNDLNTTIEDMGALDEFGNEVYRYGNPGEGANIIGPVSGATCEVTTEGVCGVNMPKAKREYNALELSLSRRFSGGWLANVSYVYSDLWGNYTGLQNTDEIRPPTLGYGSGNSQKFGTDVYRGGGNANRVYDLDEIFFDSNGNKGVFGALPTDRPHVFKLYGSKQFSFGTDIGIYFRAMSGTPVSTQVWTDHNIPQLAYGRGDKGRTPTFSQTDLMIAHEIKTGENQKVRFEFNFDNLFNQKTAMFVYDRFNREEYARSGAGVDLSGVDLIQGYDVDQAILATSMGEDAKDPRYGRETMFNTGFSGRFMVKFIF